VISFLEFSWLCDDVTAEDIRAVLHDLSDEGRGDRMRRRGEKRVYREGGGYGRGVR